MPQNIKELAASTRDHLRYWAQAGVPSLAFAAASAQGAQQSAQQAAPQQTAPAASPNIQTEAPTKAPMNTESLTDSLPVICAELAGCTRCTLSAGRTNLVFGVGDPNARVVFVGEAPGRDEDLQGEPFIGRAGKLLTDIIERGMGLPRSSVYICNTVKCRPPENRNPLPEELAACEPFLVRQLLTIRPRVIVALGKFAAQSICKSETPIGKLRGNWHTYEGIDVMPTFHPAYLLRNPSAKREVWADIQAVMERMGTKKGAG